MNLAVTALEYISIAWLFGWGAVAVLQLSFGARDSALFGILFHVFFTGVPVALDKFVRHYVFERYYGLSLGVADEASIALYSLYVMLVPPAFYWLGRCRGFSGGYYTDYSGLPRFHGLQRYWRLLFLGLPAPLLAVLLAPKPSLYSHYAVVLAQESNRSFEVCHFWVALSAKLSILCAASILVFVPRISWRMVSIILPWVLFALWVDGKRNTIAMVVLLAAVIVWQKRVVHGKALVAIGGMAVVLLIGASLAYQVEVRSVGDDGWNQTYENVRNDYGRDSRIKMAIYAELHPEKLSILDYRGQSLLHDLTFFVPRTWWQEKPYPYGVYFTSAALDTSGEVRLYGWTFTTSWLGEAIANFGIFAGIVGPGLLALVTRLGDSRRNAVVQCLTILVVTLLQTVNLPAFMPIFLIWAASIMLADRPRWPRYRPAS